MKKNKTVLQFIVCVFISSLLFSCSNNIAKKTKANAGVIAMLQQEYKAHIEKNAGLLVSGMSDSFISVDRGRVTMPTAEESTKRFGTYFNSVNFIKWDDMEPPIIKLSNDNSMAYAVVRKEVIL